MLCMGSLYDTAKNLTDDTNKTFQGRVIVKEQLQYNQIGCWYLRSADSQKAVA